MSRILPSEQLQGLRWRMVGPYRGSRVVAVAGHPTDPMTFYFGACGGGVWKTIDGGFLWHNVSDGFFKRSSVGALAVSTSHPDILYAGMGETSIIHGQTHGDGVYRSNDGGRTWQHLGLAETHNIGRLRIHPTDPDIAYAAAFGHRYGPHQERGVFRTSDGGRTWDQVLFRSERAGAIDLTLDPNNPKVLYVALWEAFAAPWTHSSGGPDSSIYKSVDGGDSWVEITRNPGLPKGLLGKIGIAVSPARSGRLWALIEHAQHGGVYRSDDGGNTWAWMDDNRNFQVRASYFSHLTADPSDPDTVYLPNRKLWKSIDGGRSFAQLNTPYVDQHDLWVDPHDSRRMILGNDGGCAVSFNGGLSWSTLLNQPTAEIYRLAVDNHFPYRIYGSQQDNSTLCLPSRSERGPISILDWYDIGGGESGFIAVRADDPEIVYSSDLPGLGVTRYDHRNHQIREIGPWADPDSWDMDALRYRFNWAVPVVVSPHDSGILYVAGNVLFRTVDEGQRWDIISPDLTRADVRKMIPSGGPVTREDSSADQYGNISAIAESPVERGVIWVGTNDGLVQVTRDDGATWQNVTPPDFPEWCFSQVEPSSHHAGTAYVAASNHFLDDFTPYLFKTADYGAHWTRADAGIPPGHFLRVVREDPVRAGLLYAGTEAGIFFSLDAGASWQPLQTNLPIASVYDLLVKNADLVAATHGRGMWILDDLSPLRQLTPDIAEQTAHLFVPQPAYRLTRQVWGLNSLNSAYTPWAANNPPSGIIVQYYLRSAPAEPLTISLLDSAGVVIQTFTSSQTESSPTPVGPYAYHVAGGAVSLRTKPAWEDEPGVKWGALTLEPEPGTVVPARAGLNRFVVPLEHPAAWKIPGLLGGGLTGPMLVPGRYQIRLTLGEQSWTEAVEVLKDPRVNTTQAEFEAQFALMVQIRDQFSALHRTAWVCRDLRRQIEERLRASGDNADADALRGLGTSIQVELTAIEEALIQPRATVDVGEMDRSSHLPTRLDGKLDLLGYKVMRSDDPPTDQAYAMYEDIMAQVQAQFERFRRLHDDAIPAFNRAYADAEVPAIAIPADLLPSQKK
ncbi:MAG: glycosyl hydrolase [Anaerolineae bacterium]|nr:glycosyl hydrolase [Anaerolineae bacterium]